MKTTVLVRLVYTDRQVAARTDGPAAAAVESAVRVSQSDGGAHQLTSSSRRQRAASYAAAQDASGLSL